jgi:hypothetical protein
MSSPIVWGAACALALAAPAFAATSANTQLCWGADGTESSPFGSCSSTYDPVTGQTNSTVNRTLPNPDGTSPDQLFAGQASATATADTWRVSTLLTLTNYRRDNYIWTESASNGTYAATTAAATASTTDTVTVSGGTGVYALSYILSLDGLLGSSDSGLLNSSFCASLYIPDGTGTATSYCLSAGSPTPSSITLSYADLPFGGPVTPTLSISAYGFVQPIYAADIDALGADTFSASGFAQFGSTVHLTSLLVTDATGNAIPGVSIDSDSGYTYPLDPQNTAPVPEPAGAWLLSAGLAWMLLHRRRARQAC